MVFCMKQLLLVLSLFSFMALSADTTVVDQEIEFLITSVEQSGCSFHRNGYNHSAERAADHLRLKLRRGKKYADSAEHFIDRLASKSSWTGKAYYLECEPGKLIEVSPWMNEKLASYRQQQANQK